MPLAGKAALSTNVIAPGGINTPWTLAELYVPTP